MQHYFIKLHEAIMNGILRIFPKSLVKIFSWIFRKISSLKEAILQKLPTKATYWSAFWLGFLVLILVSCSSTKTATQIVHDIQRDTIYLSNVQYDSIFIQNDHSQEYHPYMMTSSDTDVTSQLRTDTIRIKDISIQYKYKLLRDTIYNSKVDSIPVLKEVTVTKEVKYTPWYAKALAWIGVICLLLIAIWISIKLVFKR